MADQGSKEREQAQKKPQKSNSGGEKGSGRNRLGGAGGDTRWQGLTPPGVDDADTGGQTLSKMTDQETSMAIEPAAINAMSPGRFDLEIFKMTAAAQFEAGPGQKKSRRGKEEKEDEESSKES